MDTVPALPFRLNELVAVRVLVLKVMPPITHHEQVPAAERCSVGVMLVATNKPIALVAEVPARASAFVMVYVMDEAKRTFAGAVTDNVPMVGVDVETRSTA
jgi:hypothetical protein